MLLNNSSNQQHGFSTSLIPYSDSVPADPDLWNRNLYPISIFSMHKKSKNDIKNIIISLNHMASFIDKKDIKNNRKVNIHYLVDFD